MVLSRRALNRALLARQLLLERESIGAVAAVERLVGVQAQEPQAPYVGLAARIARFDPLELSDLLASRRVVRGALMRCTVHLVTAADWVALWPLMRPVLVRNFRASQFSKQLAGVELADLLAVGRELLMQQPRTRAELGRLLAERWPGYDAASLGHAASLLTAVVQVPPRGLWAQGGQARWTPADAWLDREPVAWLHRKPDASLDREPGEAPELEPLILRYLRAFGPASVADIQAWCGLTRLAEQVERMRPELRQFTDEQGRELLDVADGPLPDPDTPAPPRFLGPFDNVQLSHADRRRIIDPADRDHVYQDRLMRTFLLDGFVAGTWRVDGGTLTLSPTRPLDAAERSALTEEAARVGAILAPAARALKPRFGRAAIAGARRS